MNPPNREEFLAMSDADKIKVLDAIERGTMALTQTQLDEIITALGEECVTPEAADQLRQAALDDLIEWATMVDKIPGSIGRLLDRIHAATLDSYRCDIEERNDEMPNRHEHRRWFPVLLMARRLSEELAEKMEIIKSDPDGVRARLNRFLDRQARDVDD